MTNLAAKASITFWQLIGSVSVHENEYDELPNETKENLFLPSLPCEEVSEKFGSDRTTLMSTGPSIFAKSCALVVSLSKFESWFASLGNGRIRDGSSPTIESGPASSRGSNACVFVKYRGEVCRSDSCQNMKARPINMVTGTIHHFREITRSIKAESNE